MFERVVALLRHFGAIRGLQRTVIGGPAHKMPVIWLTFAYQHRRADIGVKVHGDLH